MPSFSDTGNWSILRGQSNDGVQKAILGGSLRIGLCNSNKTPFQRKNMYGLDRTYLWNRGGTENGIK